jgi:hypothetical protein
MTQQIQGSRGILIGTVVLALGLLVAPARADLAVKFLGTATGGELSEKAQRTIDETGVDVTGFGCFELPIYDLETGHRVGFGIDCLNVFDAGGDSAGDGLQIEAKTFFVMPQGVIVNHGCTSARPFFAGVGNVGVTHMTGSIGPGEFGAEPDASMPAECVEANGIIYTSRGFSNTTGEARLSGAVNLSNVGAGEITFSCLFVVKLDHPADSPGKSHRRGRGHSDR